MRTDRSAVQRLRALPLFEECADGDLRQLTKGGRVTNVPANWTFIHDETPGDACYVILDGAAEVRKGEDVVATLGPGDVVGEIALLTAGLRTAAVVATAPTELLHIDAASFKKLVDERPSLREALVRSHQS